MHRLRVKDVHFKEQIFSTWCNFVHLLYSVHSSGQSPGLGSESSLAALVSGCLTDIHLTKLSGTTTAQSLCPWPALSACPTVHPYSARWIDEQTDRQTELSALAFFASCLFRAAAYNSGRDPLHFIRVFTASCILKWIFSFSSPVCRYHRHLASSSSLIPFRFRIFHSWHGPTLARLRLSLVSQLPLAVFPGASFAYSIWRHIYSPFFGMLLLSLSHFNFNYFVTCRTAPTQSPMHTYFIFYSPRPTLRIRNVACPALSILIMLSLPGVQGCISIIYPKVKTKLTSATDAISGAINTLALGCCPALFRTWMCLARWCGKSPHQGKAAGKQAN